MKPVVVGQLRRELLVLGRGVNSGGKRTWICLCTCGTRVRVREDHLVAGRQVSCGHLRASREVRVAAAAKIDAAVRLRRARKGSAYSRRKLIERRLRERGWL